MGTFLSGQMLLCIQQNITHKYYNNIIFLSPSAIVTTLYPFIIVTWRNSTSAIRVMIRCLWSGPRGQWFNQTCDRINQRVLSHSSRSLYLFQAITVLLNSCYHQCEVFIFLGKSIQQFFVASSGNLSIFFLALFLLDYFCISFILYPSQPQMICQVVQLMNQMQNCRQSSLCHDGYFFDRLL